MNEDFKFDMSNPRYRYSDERLIKSLSKFAKERNFSYFSVKEFNSWDKKIAWGETYVRRFGSWRNALERAGVLKLGKKRKHDPKELIEHLKECWKTLGHYPSTREFNEYNKKIGMPVSEMPYRRRWGSVRNACKRIEEHYYGKITEEELYIPLEKSGRPTIPLSLRYDVLKRDNYTCMKCGRSQVKFKTLILEVDHIKPYSKGGSTIMENLQTLCYECNRGKRNKED